MAASQVKRCPFCGSVAHYADRDSNWTHSPIVICELGHVFTTINSNSMRETIEEWNRRDCGASDD